MQFRSENLVQCAWRKYADDTVWSQWAKMIVRSQNKSLKPTVTHVTLFAENAKVAPYYGGLVPPFYTLQ